MVASTARSRGLDPIMSESVTQMINRAKERLQVTSVVIISDLASAFEVADQIAFLHEGRIVAQGPPDAVRASSHPEVQRFLALWDESRQALR